MYLILFMTGLDAKVGLRFELRRILCCLATPMALAIENGSKQ